MHYSIWPRSSHTMSSMLLACCVQSGVLATALYLAGVFLFNVTANMAYHGPILVLLVINAIVARFTDVTTIYVVPTPSKPKDKGGVPSGSTDVATPSKPKEKSGGKTASGDAAKED